MVFSWRSSQKVLFRRRRLHRVNKKNEKILKNPKKAADPGKAAGGFGPQEFSNTVIKMQDCYGDKLSLVSCLQPVFRVGKLLQICPFSVKAKLGDPTEATLSSHHVSRVVIHVLPEVTGKAENFYLGFLKFLQDFLILQIFGVVVKLVITTYTALMVLMEEDSSQRVPLMDYLWRCNFTVFCLYTVAVRWSLEFKWADWLVLFRKSNDIHRNFRMLGMKLHLKRASFWL